MTWRPCSCTRPHATASDLGPPGRALKAACSYLGAVNCERCHLRGHIVSHFSMFTMTCGRRWQSQWCHLNQTTLDSQALPAGMWGATVWWPREDYYIQHTWEREGSSERVCHRNHSGNIHVCVRVCLSVCVTVHWGSARGTWNNQLPHMLTDILRL